MEGHWLVDWLWESHVTFFLLHNKLLQVAIWLGPWTISLLRVLTTWQTSVCWFVIYLCEVVSLGVWSFGSTLCTLTWYQNFYEESLSVLIKIWNRCCRKFERVSGFWIFCVFVAYGSCSIASRALFPFGNSFCFTENHFCLIQKHPFRQIWRYNVTVMDIFF